MELGFRNRYHKSKSLSMVVIRKSEDLHLVFFISRFGIGEITKF